MQEFQSRLFVLRSLSKTANDWASFWFEYKFNTILMNDWRLYQNVSKFSTRVNSSQFSVVVVGLLVSKLFFCFCYCKDSKILLFLCTLSMKIFRENFFSIQWTWNRNRVQKSNFYYRLRQSLAINHHYLLSHIRCMLHNEKYQKYIWIMNEWFDFLFDSH